MSDLADELKGKLESFRHVITVEEIEVVERAIAALQPELPEDVAELVNRLQEPYEQNQSRRVAEERQAADMLERQQRENAKLDKMLSDIADESTGRLETIGELQQHIDELEANIIACVRKEWAPLDDIAEADALDWFAKEYPAALQENEL